MNLRNINEAFKRQYAPILNESVDNSEIEQLRKDLVMKSMSVVANGGNIKSIEVALQGVIEDHFPDHCWWEVTNCSIFNELLSGTKPREVCDIIIDNLKPEFSNNVKESMTEDSNKSVYDFNGQRYVYDGDGWTDDVVFDVEDEDGETIIQSYCSTTGDSDSRIVSTYEEAAEFVNDVLTGYGEAGKHWQDIGWYLD